MSLVKFNFSRTGKKHVVNKDLLLEEVDDNIAGVAHKPSTIAKNTNLLLDSEDIITSERWNSVTYNNNGTEARNTIEEAPSIEPPINGIKVYKVTRINSGSIYVRPQDMFLYPDVNYVFSIYVKGGDGTISSSIQEWLVGQPSNSAEIGDPMPNDPQVFPFDFRYTLSSVNTPSVNVYKNIETTHHEIEELDNGWFRVVVSFKITRDQYEEILNSERYTKDNDNLVNNVFVWKNNYFKYRFVTFYPTLSEINDFAYFAGQQLYTVTDEDISNLNIIRDYVSTTSFDESIDSSNEQSVARGIKLQGTSKNILTNSSDFTLNWTTPDDFDISNDPTIADPKGGTNAYKLESNNAYDSKIPSIERIITETSLTTSKSKIFSVFARAGSTNYIRLQYSQENTSGNKTYHEAYFDLSTGSYVLSRYGDSDPIKAGSEYIGKGWYRIYITCNPQIDYISGSKVSIFVMNFPHIYDITSAQTPVSVYLYGPQVEDNIPLNSFYQPSDYIETQGTALENTQEDISLSNASNYINQVSQTIFLELELNDVYSSSTILTLYNSISFYPILFISQEKDSDGSNKKLNFNYLNYDVEFYFSKKTINLPDAGNVVSVALAYDPTNLSIYLNGDNVLNEGEGHGFILDENNVLDTVKFGPTTNSPVARNYIKSFAIFRRKLSDANLQAITSGNALKQIKPSSETIFYGLEQLYRYSFYSFKHVNKLYDGPLVKVRRSSDNETLDLSESNGWVSTEVLGIFAEESNVYVETWYDQSGNGNHITNADTTKQPMIYQGGVGPITVNGNIACYFDGVNDSLNATFSTPIGADKELCTFILATPSSVSDSTIAGFKDSDPGARAGSHRNIVINSGDIQIQTDLSEYTGSNNAQVDVPFLFSSFMLDGVTEVFTNGIFHGQTFNPNMSAVDQFSLGKDAGTESGFFNGYVQEVLMYNDDIYSERIKNENHINDYYNSFLSFDKFISLLIPEDEEFGFLSRSVNLATTYNKGLVCVCSQGKSNVMYSYVFS